MPTVRYLKGKSINDALELLDLLMSAGLLGGGRSGRPTGRERRARRDREAAVLCRYELRWRKLEQ